MVEAAVAIFLSFAGVGVVVPKIWKLGIEKQKRQAQFWNTVQCLDELSMAELAKLTNEELRNGLDAIGYVGTYHYNEWEKLNSISFGALAKKERAKKRVDSDITLYNKVYNILHYK